ncbi:MAG: hypothetical protein FWF70_06755 [Bacteroidetes bacterium]|nr:hypothetical protein [Bacteroidota bacterium]MCL1968699.1 hypothetical protein [Bacteroidota bacterium]
MKDHIIDKYPEIETICVCADANFFELFDFDPIGKSLSLNDLEVQITGV